MSYNISYFLDTFPNNFSSYNTSWQIDYYNDHLKGFSELVGNETQQWVVETFHEHSALEWLWNSVHDPQYVQHFLDQGYNTTQIFFEYLNSPALVGELYSYFTTTPVTTTAEPSVCNYVDQIGNQIVVYMLIPAIVVIILLSFLRRRTSRLLGCCYSRPHLLYPINFVDEHDQRWAYASVFAIITYKVLSLFDNFLFWRPEEFDDPEWTKTYGWLKVFVVIINVTWLCVVYYPFFACLVLRRMLIANIIALLYICPWIWYVVEVTQVCPFWDTSHSKDERDISIMNFVLDIPVVLAFLCLIVTYCFNLVKTLQRLCAKKRKNKYETNEMLGKLMDKDPLAVQYVRDLMKRPPKVAPDSMKEKVIRKVTYKKIIGFKYSPRVLCTMVVAGLCIYKSAVLFTGWNEMIYQGLVEAYNSLEGTDVLDEEQFKFYKEYLHIAKWSVLASTWVSFLLHVVFMIHMVILYRRHLRRYFQGNRSWHFDSSSDPTNVMIASLRYSGYQMAYIVYGHFILFLLLAIVMCAIGVFIALPIKYKYSGPLIKALIDYWPTLLMTIAFMLMQKALAKFCLLQDFGKYLALNNRRFYHIMSFFFFFYNFLVGLFSCLKRIVFSVVFGTILISRLDHCLLMRGFERFDPGFRSYLGMLTIDIYHNHPVMKSFIYILQQMQEDKRQAAVSFNNQAGPGNEKADIVQQEKGLPGDGEKSVKRSKKYINKWFKAVTLMRNPTLRLDLMKDEIKQHKGSKHAVRDAVINRTGDVAAGAIGLGILSGAT